MTNFSQLWEAAMKAADTIGSYKLKSTLINYSESKEKVCRKLGIVGETDIIRIVKRLRIRFPRSTGVIEPRRRRESKDGK